MFGVNLIEFSIDNNVTLSATRTRLKKLFAQTDERSQSALVSASLRTAIIAPNCPR
jgi:hypothetical protein